MRRLVRSVSQLLFIAAFCFFAWHYITKPELRQCVSIPVNSLRGVSKKVDLDRTKVDKFLSQLGDQLNSAGEKGSELLSNLAAVETSDSASPQEELLDRGQYLYCKAVVEKVEKNLPDTAESDS